MSYSVPMNDPPCLPFQLRALFGLSPRAEAIAFLLFHPESNASAVARAVRYSLPQIQEALTDLALAQVVEWRIADKSERLYAAGLEVWTHIRVSSRICVERSARRRPRLSVSLTIRAFRLTPTA
jgi:hypothetical protein